MKTYSFDADLYKLILTWVFVHVLRANSWMRPSNQNKRNTQKSRGVNAEKTTLRARISQFFFCSFNLFLIYFVVVFSIHSIILATTYEIFMMLLWKCASFYSNFRFTIFYAKHNLFGWIVHYSVNMSKWLRRIPGNFMKIICMVFLKIFSTSKKCVFFKALE